MTGALAGQHLPAVRTLWPDALPHGRAPPGRGTGFNQRKNWRELPTRYDKHALVYRGGLVLAAMLLWL